MAKSLRSKRMRRNRAVKREKIYGPKELARLKRTVVGLTDNGAVVNDAEMREIAVVRDAADVAKELAEKRLNSAYDPKTMRDKHGCYPPWMNQRRIRQHQARLQKQKQKPGSGKGQPSGAAAAKRGGKKRAKRKSAW